MCYGPNMILYELPTQAALYGYQKPEYTVESKCSDVSLGEVS